MKRKTVNGTFSAKSGASSRIPPQWAWHHHVLQTLRSRLAESCDLQSSDAAEPLEGDTNDQADCATDEFDHDLALSVLSHDQSALNEVDDALRRITAGTYGVCEDSGKPIPAARLRAVPWTRYRKDVQERLEKDGLVNHTRLAPATDIHGPLARRTDEPPAPVRRHRTKAEKRKS